MAGTKIDGIFFRARPAGKKVNIPVSAGRNKKQVSGKGPVQTNARRAVNEGEFEPLGGVAGI